MYKKRFPAAPLALAVQLCLWGFLSGRSGVGCAAASREPHRLTQLQWAHRSLSLQAPSLSRGALAFVTRSLPASSVPTPPPCLQGLPFPQLLISLASQEHSFLGDLILYRGRGPHYLSPFTPPLPCEAFLSIYVLRQTELLVWSFSPPLRQVVEPISQPGK